MAIIAQKYVIRFDILVNDTFYVQELYTWQHFNE